MYTVVRVERYDGVPDCARVLSRHRSLEEAELVKRRVQSLLERSHLSGETGMKRDDIRILCTAGKPELGREIAARQLKQLTVVTAARRPA